MSMPYQPLNTGDVYDDDAQVIDDLVEQQAEPAKPLPDVMVTDVVKRPTPITRLQTGRQLVETGWEAVLILPPDEFRKSIELAMNSEDATDVIYLGSDAQSARNGGSMYQANPLSLPGYTGAVWVYNPGATAVTVSWWAVTK